MGTSVPTDELQSRLTEALARKDDETVRNLLVEIGKAELKANGSEKPVRPLPAEAPPVTAPVRAEALEASG